MADRSDASGARAGSKNRPITLSSSSHEASSHDQDPVSSSPPPGSFEFPAHEHVTRLIDPLSPQMRPLEPTEEGELSQGMGNLMSSRQASPSPVVPPEDHVFLPPTQLDLAAAGSPEFSPSGSPVLGSSPPAAPRQTLLQHASARFPSQFVLLPAPSSDEIAPGGSASGSSTVPLREWYNSNKNTLKRSRPVIESSSPVRSPVKSPPVPAELFPATQASSEPAGPVPIPQQLLVSEVLTAAEIIHYAGLYLGTIPGARTSTTQYHVYNCIRSLTDNHLLFPEQAEIVKRYGHCKYWVVRKEEKNQGTITIVETPKLVEPGQNNDAPRVQPPHKPKVYVYHLLAYARAYQNDKHLTLGKLAAVSRTKQDDQPLTIAHQCGHKWCMNTDHYRVRAKKFNDEQEYCHFGLQKVNVPLKMDQIRMWYCGHEPVRCWTINYSGIFASTKVAWAAIH